MLLRVAVMPTCLPLKLLPVPHWPARSKTFSFSLAKRLPTTAIRRLFMARLNLAGVQLRSAALK